MNLLKFLFGTKNDRELKKLWPIVREINRIEEELQKQNLADEDFPKRTAELKARYQKGETLDQLLPEAYALLKNACRHLVGTTEEVCGHTLTWNMIPFDVQLIGGIVLHQGKISEMQTGEGKTLVATMPLYLNALAGKNVQLVTVNDYLALRDATWMGSLQVPRPHGRLHPELDGLGGTPRPVQLRHHLRHEQRVRLRLPA